jgi:hypothetical protein
VVMRRAPMRSPNDDANDDDDADDDDYDDEMLMMMKMMMLMMEKKKMMVMMKMIMMKMMMMLVKMMMKMMMMKMQKNEFRKEPILFVRQYYVCVKHRVLNFLHFGRIGHRIHSLLSVCFDIMRGFRCCVFLVYPLSLPHNTYGQPSLSGNLLFVQFRRL